MKNNKGLLLIIAIVTLAQNIFFSSDDTYFSYYFALGYPLENYEFAMLIYIVLTIGPIIFISFYFSETIKKYTSGYGKLLLIRNYSKYKLFSKLCIKVAAETVLIVLIQFSVYLVHNGELRPIGTEQIIRSVFTYGLGLIAMAYLQMLIELFVDSTKAVIINSFYLLASYVSSFIVKSKVIRLFLFPSFMFGCENGALTSGNKYYISVLIITVWIAILFLCGNIKFKRTDIF